MPRPFLADRSLRQVTLSDARGLEPLGIALGQGNSALEVLVVQAPRPPKDTSLRAVWKARQGNRPAPLLVVALHGERATLCGPAGDERLAMISELDAVVACLYGLEERHLAHIFETFHEAWRPGTSCDHPTLGDYDRRLAATLEHFRAWQRRAAGPQLKSG